MEAFIYYIAGASLIFNIILLFILLSGKRQRVDIEIKEEPKIIGDYHIEYFPTPNKYAAVYRGKYPFESVGGTWSLHEHVSHFQLHDSQSEAERFLKRFFECRGIGTKKLKANI